MTTEIPNYVLVIFDDTFLGVYKLVNISPSDYYLLKSISGIYIGDETELEPAAIAFVEKHLTEENKIHLPLEDFQGSIFKLTRYD